jgi:hypothetical protein
VPDPGLSPYTLVLGLAARSPLGVADVLSIAALFNVVLFLVGLRRFVGCFSKATLAPIWTLIATLFLWGPEAPWRWSGYLNANSIGFGLPYPSMFATALLFFALTALINFCDGGDRRQLAALVVLAPRATPSRVRPWGWRGWRSSSAGSEPCLHAESGSWPAHRQLWAPRWWRGRCTRRSGSWALRDGTTACTPSCTGWSAPARSSPSSPSQCWRFASVPTTGIRSRSWPAAPRSSSSSGNYSLGRILPLGMLALHVALGVWLAERAPALWRQGTGTQRLGSALAAGAVLVAGVFGCRAGLARAVPRLLLPSSVADDPRLETGDAGLSFLGRETSPGDVALVATREAARVSPALGAKVVAPGYIAPFIEDVDRRYTDVAQFFRSPSAGERQVIIERYGVSFVLFDLRFETPDRALGTVVHRDDRYVLVAVTARPTMP